MAAGNENVEIPALGFGEIANIMNEYVVSNGPISKNCRSYNRDMVRLHWRLMQKRDTKISLHDEEITDEEKL